MTSLSEKRLRLHHIVRLWGQIAGLGFGYGLWYHFTRIGIPCLFHHLTGFFVRAVESATPWALVQWNKWFVEHTHVNHQIINEN